MHQGYLIVETRGTRPNLVRLLGAERAAWTEAGLEADPDRPTTRYCARFPSLDLALMHAHSALRGRLVDVDARLYRASPVDAVAAVDALDLPHERLYLDASIAADPRFDALSARFRRRRVRRDRLWNLVGILAVLLLVVLGSPVGL